MKASIIVPLYNKEDIVNICLKSILSQTIKCEVIVIDDDSTDSSYEIAKKYPVKLMRIEHSGTSVAKNVGVTAATGEIILFIDADEIVPLNFVEKILKQFEDCSVIAVKVYFWPVKFPGFWSNCISTFRMVIPFESDRARLRAIRKSFFEYLGGFSSELSIMEDLDFKLKCEEECLTQGLKIVTEKGVSIDHIEDLKLLQFFKHAMWYGYSLLDLFKKRPKDFLIIFLEINILLCTSLSLPLLYFLQFFGVLYVTFFLLLLFYFLLVFFAWKKTNCLYSLFFPIIMLIRAWGWFFGIIKRIGEILRVEIKKVL